MAWRSSNVAFLLVLCKSFFSSKWFSFLVVSLGSVQKFFLVEVVFVPRSSCCGSSSAGEFFVFLCNAASIALDLQKLIGALSYPSPVKSTACSSWSPQLADSLTEAVLRAIRNSIPDRFIDPEQRPLARFFFGCGRFC